MDESAMMLHFPEAPVFEPLALDIIDTIYHTRNIEDARKIRLAIRLGIKVLDDIK